MAVPKSVVKIKKDGVEYVSNCDRIQYTLTELIRAALRDTGKLICRKTKDNIRASNINQITGKSIKAVQYWVKWKQKVPMLQVGIKAFGFYIGFFETGTSEYRKYAFLQNAVKNSVAEIVKIQSQYLSALEDEAKAMSMIDESETQGSDDT